MITNQELGKYYFQCAVIGCGNEAFHYITLGTYEIQNLEFSIFEHYQEHGSLDGLEMKKIKSPGRKLLEKILKEGFEPVQHSCWKAHVTFTSMTMFRNLPGAYVQPHDYE